jgi:hypothetical protein
MFILHISYEVRFAPTLDNYIFDALEGFIDDMDCMRDDDIRDLYFYFPNQNELDHAINLINDNGKKRLDENENGACLLDFIRMDNHERDQLQDSKLKLRKRITEIYIRHKQRAVVEDKTEDKV